MNLNTENWKSFYLRELFSIQMGNGFDKNKMNDDNPQINFVSRVSYNNGVDIKVDYIDGIVPFEAGLVTVALGGSYLGSCFVQEEPFYTAQNVAVMKSKFPEMSKQVNLFISGLVRFESKVKYYAFGRELNSHINKDFDIKLPVIIDKYNVPIIDQTHKYSENGYIPDWQFIENYIKSLHYKPLTTKNTNGRTLELKTKEWKRFYLGRLFDIKKGKRLTSEDQEEGNNLYIGAIDSNNGVANHIGQSPIHKGNTISLSYNGSVGEAFYQPDPYWATDDVNALYSKYSGFNKYIGLFIATVIRQEKYRFSYGRKWTLENMVNTEICLPIRYNSNDLPYIDDTNKYSDEGYIPDWQFMEDYIKSLPYGDRI